MRKQINKNIMLFFVFSSSPLFASDTPLYEELITKKIGNHENVSKQAQPSEIISLEADLQSQLKLAESKIKLMEKEYSKLLLKNCELEHRLEVCLQSLNFFMKEYRCAIREKFELTHLNSNLTQDPSTKKERNDPNTSQTEAIMEDPPLNQTISSKLTLSYFKRSWESLSLWLGLSRHKNSVNQDVDRTQEALQKEFSTHDSG